MPRKMKESGVEWLGQIPEGWGVRRNKYCYACGKEIVGSKSSDTTLLSLTTRGVKEKPAGAVGGKQPETFDTYQVVRPNDIVLCLFDLDCSAVFSGISHYDGMISPAYKVVSCKRFVCSQYAEYWFRFVSEGRKFKAYAKNLRYTLSYEEFETLPMLCPPLPEQERIAAFLDERCAKIDGMIAEAKASIEDYKKWKQSLVSDAVTGRNVNELGGNGSVVPSGVDWCPEIPKAWKRVNPKALFSLRTQRAISGERQLTASQHHGIIYQDDFMRLENQKVVTVEKDFSILKHVEPGDFVISMRSFQGGLEYSESRGCISSAYVMLIPNLKKVYPPFYRWFFKSCKYINALQSTSNLIRDGQAMRYSNFAQVSLFDIPISDQKRIATFLDEKCAAIDKLVGEKESLIADLEAYKKSLIFETVTGKREVEKHEE